MSHPHPELSAPGTAAEGRPAGHPARRPGRGRPQHDRLRVRRPAADRRLRRALPRGPPPRRRPDPPRLRRRSGTGSTQVEALVLTHGHEDHIGATPYLLRERGDIPLVGSELTLALLGSQAARAPAQGDGAPRGQGGRPDHLRPLRPGVRRRQPLHPRRARGRDPHRRRHGAAHRRLQDGPAAARRPDHRPARVRPAGRGGRRPVPDRLHQRRGARASPPPRRTSPRSSTGSSTRREQRIIVACFASHVHRVQQVLDAAAAHGRKVGYVGRSMVRNMAIAQDLGYLTVPPGVLVDAKELADLPARERQVLISTGSQGEPLSRAEPDRPAQPPLRAHRGGRHGHPRLAR